MLLGHVPTGMLPRRAFHPGRLDGIVIDDALYEGAFTYAEAVAAGADRFDMFYWGPPE